VTQATKAYNNFESCQIPFAAVKLNICLQNSSKKEIDGIVEDNFRTEKDTIFKENEKYIILMKRTTIEAAERAVNRLKAKVGDIIARNCENLKDNSSVYASAYIFDSSRVTRKMRVKYLNLSPNINSFDRKNFKMPLNYGEYLRWFELPKTVGVKINNIINVIV
jgi:uncharacterized protein YdaT